jgi:hypothetical protein
VTRDPRRFVDHDEIFVFQQHFERQAGVGRGIEIYGPRKSLQGDQIAGSHRIALFCPPPADSHSALGDESLGPSPAQLG